MLIFGFLSEKWNGCVGFHSKPRKRGFPPLGKKQQQEKETRPVGVSLSPEAKRMSEGYRQMEEAENEFEGSR